MKIIKKVVRIGNGAAVYVPKEYEGKEIVVVLPEGIDEIRNRILYKLIEYMPNILGVYLYGSYSRGEQNRNSDIDILIITKEKDEKLRAILEDIDLRAIDLESLKKSIKNFPAIIMPILKEAKSFLNPLLLEDLKNYEIDLKKFNWHFQDIKRILKIIETFVEIDDKDISPTHIYSLIMRIRICYMMESLLKNKFFSNKSIKELLKEHGLNEKKINKFLDIYREIREDKEVKTIIEKKEILDLIKIVRDYSEKIKNETKKKITKRN